jgi:hypothetical protein
LQEYALPHDAGIAQSRWLHVVQLFTECEVMLWTGWQSRSIHRECSRTLQNIGTKRRNQKFVLALGDRFADMAAILTVGFDGMSLL